MVRSEQQMLVARDFLGLGSSIASGAGGNDIINPHYTSKQYSDAIAIVKSNILEGVHSPAAAGWLYGNNHINSLNSSTLAFPGMRRGGDWNNAVSRQQFLSFRNSQGERLVEKSDDSYLLAQTRGYGSPVLSISAQDHSLLANFSTDHSGAVAKKAFPFLAPAPHEQALPVRVQPIPVASAPRPVGGQVPMSAPFFSSFVAGGVPARTQTRMLSSDSCDKEISAQLTIFYAGNVNVYDAISLAKAQEIMLLAASGSPLPVNVSNKPTGQFAPAGMSHAVGLQSSPDQQERLQLNLLTGQADQFAADQVSQSSPPASKQQTESSLPSTPSSFPEGQPVVPRALPQARKASLARFLERRKERVQSKSPYLVDKSFL